MGSLNPAQRQPKGGSAVCAWQMPSLCLLRSWPHSAQHSLSRLGELFKTTFFLSFAAPGLQLPLGGSKLCRLFVDNVDEAEQTAELATVHQMLFTA
jgi:hypothetical protein